MSSRPRRSARRQPSSSSTTSTFTEGPAKRGRSLFIEKRCYLRTSYKSRRKRVENYAPECPTSCGGGRRLDATCHSSSGSSPPGRPHAGGARPACARYVGDGGSARARRQKPRLGEREPV